MWAQKLNFTRRLVLPEMVTFVTKYVAPTILYVHGNLIQMKAFRDSVEQSLAK